MFCGIAAVVFRFALGACLSEPFGALLALLALEKTTKQAFLPSLGLRVGLGLGLGLGFRLGFWRRRLGKACARPSSNHANGLALWLRHLGWDVGARRACCETAWAEKATIVR